MVLWAARESVCCYNWGTLTTSIKLKGIWVVRASRDSCKQC